MFFSVYKGSANSYPVRGVKVQSVQRQASKLGLGPEAQLLMMGDELSIGSQSMSKGAKNALNRAFQIQE